MMPLLMRWYGCVGAVLHDAVVDDFAFVLALLVADFLLLENSLIDAVIVVW
jgi:hypothetical protein